MVVYYRVGVKSRHLTSVDLFQCQVACHGALFILAYSIKMELRVPGWYWMDMLGGRGYDAPLWKVENKLNLWAKVRLVEEIVESISVSKMDKFWRSERVGSRALSNRGSAGYHQGAGVLGAVLVGK